MLAVLYEHRHRNLGGFVVDGGVSHEPGVVLALGVLRRAGLAVNFRAGDLARLAGTFLHHAAQAFPDQGPGAFFQLYAA